MNFPIFASLNSNLSDAELSLKCVRLRKIRNRLWISSILFPFALLLLKPLMDGGFIKITGLLLLAGLIGFYSLLAVVVGVRYDDKYRLLKQLPQYLCSDALELTNSSPAADSWRQSVLSKNRQFRRFDLEMIKILHASDKSRKAIGLSSEEACRQLHGLA